MTKDRKQYIQNVRDALRDNVHARLFYFPPDKSRRREMNLRLAREVGFGLRNFPDASNDLGDLYGSLIVMFSFDTTGVCIDAKAFFSEMRSAILSPN